VCARRGLREAGKEFLLLVCGHTTAGVFDLQPEECYSAFAPFSLVSDVLLGLFVIGEGYFVPAFRRAGPRTTDGNGDGFLGAVFGELDGVGAVCVNEVYGN